MRKNLIFRGAKVYDKVTGKYYLITGEDGTAVHLNRIDGEDIPDEADKVQVTEENGIAFRFIKDTREPEVPSGYTAEDGILMKDGQPVTEQGSLKVHKVFGYVEDAVVVLTELNGQEALARYVPRRDKFQNFAVIPQIEGEDVRLYTARRTTASINALDVRGAEEGTVYLAIERTAVHAFPGKDGEEHKECFLGATLYVIKGGSQAYYETSEPVFFREVCIVNGEFFARYGYRTEAVEDTDGVERRVIVPAESGYQVLRQEDYDDDGEARYEAPVDATITWSPATKMFIIAGSTGITGVSEDGTFASFHVKANGSAVTDMALVDVASRPNGEVYTFADAAHDIVTVSVERTSDRGDIVTVG